MINFEEFKTKSGKTRMSEQEKFEFIEYINKNGTEEEKAALAFNWVDVWARDEQVPYAFCDVSSWDTWTFISGRGAGKLIDNNTPILTPYRGWIKHGDLLPGDYVFNEHGKPTKVLQIHPQKATNKLEYYRVLFNDGTHIDACGDHLWHTWTHQERKQYMRRDGARGLLPAPQDYPFDWGTYDDKVTVRTKTRTTKQILETLKIGKRGDNNHSIPLGKACVFPDRQLPIHPYLLGYWLGNGSHDSHTLTIHNDDVLDIKHKLDSIGITYKEYSNPKGTYCTTLATYILEELKNLNLFRNKHIPDMYLTSSIEQRWELIRGLLDSDGCFEGGNRIVFYNTNLNIISGAKKILGSLGCKFFETNKIGKIKGVEYKKCYSLDIKSLDVNPFNITRKSDKWVKWRNSKKSQFFRQRSRIITDIVPITPVDMMCITVDSPSALYLVGDQCVPTHNTKAGAELVRELVFNIFPNFPIRIGCITPSFSQIEAVVALGDSGVMNCLAPWQREKARFYSTSRKIVFNEGEANESQVRFYSADDPEALRGSQWHFCWLDEMAAYPDPDGILMQVAMCNRLKLPGGISAKRFITTTPKPYQWLRDLMKQAKHDDRILVTRGSTYDNAANLSDTMFREIQKYEGTKIGQQEIHGEILSGDSAGFIKKSWLRLLPSSEPLPKLDYVFTSYDPAFTAKKENDPTGFVALGIFKDLDGEYSVILLDAWADHLAYPDLRNQVIRDAERKYGEGSNNSRRPKAAIIEAKGGGNALIPDLKSTRVKIISFNPGTQDKHERLHTVSYLFKDGRVYLPESVKHKGEPVGYLADFVEQLTNFPLVQHDDMVDAISQALLLFMRGDLLNGETASDDDEDEDYDEPRYYETPKSNPYMQ